MSSAESEGDGPGARCQSRRLAPDVFLILQDDVARVLDLSRGRFYALDAVGTLLLPLALDFGPEEAARRGAAEYGVPVERVRADLKKLLDDLCRRYLLEIRPSGQPPTPPGPSPRPTAGRHRNPAPHPPPQLRVPRRLAIMLMLTGAWLCLRLVGWARTVRLWRLRHDPAGAGGGPDEAAVPALDAAVRDAAAVHPLNPQCKERALVAWHVLRGCGRPAELVVGINLYPFRMHAWVEYGPWTLTDDPARCSDYLPVVRYG